MTSCLDVIASDQLEVKIGVFCYELTSRRVDRTKRYSSLSRMLCQDSLCPVRLSSTRWGDKTGISSGLEGLMHAVNMNELTIPSTFATKVCFADPEMILVDQFTFHSK